MVRVRVATFADAEAIGRVHKRNGMGDLDLEAWRSQWEAYPFETEFRDVPIGWVLEADGGSLVGALDNVHTLYELDGKRIKGVVAAGWVVDKEQRGKSLQLMTAFLRQKGVGLALIVSASTVTAQVLTAVKIPRIPLPDYAAPCFWALSRRAFARAALLRRSVRGAALLAWPAGLALLARDLVRGSGRGHLNSAVRRLPEFDDRFDAFCHSLSATPVRLRAVRTRAVLEWRFRAAMRRRGIAIVVAERAAALLGYAILVRREGSDLGMDLYEIADLQAAADDPSTLRDLLLGSIRIAREAGADAVKLATGSPVKRAPALALKPYSYRLPFWQLYFKAESPETGSLLQAADAWDFGFFDTY